MDDMIATSCSFDEEIFSMDDIIDPKTRVVQLNVGGQYFTTLRSTLTQYHDTFLEALVSGRHEIIEHPKGFIFVDRNPEYFPLILDFLRDPSVHPVLPTDEHEKKKALCEAEYFGMKELMFPEEPVILETGLLYVCKQCNLHIGKYDDRLSKDYHAGGGKAFLFEAVVNVVCGSPKTCKFTTGDYVASNIACKKCGTYLGWYYERALDKKNNFKEGKSVVEKSKVMKVKQRSLKKATEVQQKQLVGYDSSQSISASRASSLLHRIKGKFQA